ncbi:MAG TPA: UDP-N-acetylmuramate dehydrogenase [Bdellovibrionales bacterium]|nr:UDP-N-acetylmuramate dehydrogenase [Bdellovibrionales bacterium]
MESLSLVVRPNYSLASFTSWNVGGPADNFCTPVALEELVEAYHWAHTHNLPVTVLGGGTNVLISDEGIEGFVIGLSKFGGTQVRENDGRLHISAFAGTPKSEILKIFLKYKLAPALFLAGLPGDVGGGVVMNAGVAEDFRPREFNEIVDWIEVIRPNEKIRRIQKDELKWAYRHSEGWQPGIIVRVHMSWPLESQEDILEKVKAANKLRLQKQPLELPSCGSVFRNPPGHKAGQLIEACGLKGYKIGGAQVSPKHANFIVNVGEAKARDIHRVIEHVKATVKKEKGVDLQTEVVYLGRWSE